MQSAVDLDQHVVVVGSDSTSARLAEELIRAGEDVVMIAPGEMDADVAADLEIVGPHILQVDRVRESDLRQAGIESAKAAVIVGDDDVLVVRQALAIEELNPKVRIVLEMDNPKLGLRLAPLLGECEVLSSAELAAPSFVAAALATNDTQSFEIGGRLVVAGPRDRIGGEDLAVLGDSSRSGLDALLPGPNGDIILGTEVVGSTRSAVRQSGVFGAFTHLFDRRLRYVLIGLILLIIFSTVYFHFIGVGWLASLYLALTASTDTGIGDVTDLPLSYRFGAVLIQLAGLVLSSGITAVIVDALISSRLAALTGGVRGRPRNHVVVCGLGRVGASVATRLKRRGVPVVAIERREDAVGVQRARRLRIPVIIGEAGDPGAQEIAGIPRAAVVMAVTDDDAVNLEIGLVAKDANPDVRVVTRLFDHDLAGRIERRLELGPTRSVSMLAAPAFAAAALGRRKEVIYPIGRRVLLFTEVDVEQGSRAPGLSVADLERDGGLQVLALADGDSADVWDWQPTGARVVVGDRVAVVATPAGLARLLLAVRAPRQAS